MNQYVAPGQGVRLELGENRGTLTTQVDAILPDRLLLVPVARLPVERHRILGLPAVASVATPRGLWRASGVITSCDEGGRVELGLADEPVLEQRRQFVRIETRLPGLIVPQGAVADALHTFILDVSGGGVLVAGAGRTEIGTPVHITVKLPDRQLKTDGHIARRTDDGHVGLSFHGMSTHEREALVRWIFERQRLERAAARRRGR